jgi:glycosyltransferase involved in cell wall biosynthesis
MSTLVAQLELGDRLGDQLRGLRATRHGAVRILVRSQGWPLGWVQVPCEPKALRPEAVVQALAAQLAPQVQAHLSPRRERAANGSPEIDVVVCTRNRPRDLERCLTALAAQRYRRYRVIVVDNAPTDDATERVARRFGVTYVVEPQPGLDNARNRGLAAASAPIVAYTDDDGVADPGWLDALAAGFFSDDVDCVTGLVVPSELETVDQLLFEDVYGGMGKGLDERILSFRERRVRYVPHELGVGCNMAFRRASLELVGGFDPRLDTGTPTGGGGDLDAFQRVAELQGVLVYRPDALVSHRHRRTRGGLRRQLFDNGRGYGAFYLATFVRVRGVERLRVAAASTRWFCTLLARLGRKLVRRERLPIALILAEVAGALVAPLCLLRSRQPRPLTAPTLQAARPSTSQGETRIAAGASRGWRESLTASEASRAGPATKTNGRAANR